MPVWSVRQKCRAGASDQQDTTGHSGRSPLQRKVQVFWIRRGHHSTTHHSPRTQLPLRSPSTQHPSASTRMQVGRKQQKKQNTMKPCTTKKERRARSSGRPRRLGRGGHVRHPRAGRQLLQSRPGDDGTQTQRQEQQLLPHNDSDAGGSPPASPTAGPSRARSPMAEQDEPGPKASRLATRELSE